MKKGKGTNNIVYYDVDSIADLPELNDKKVRYLDFIGGTKEIRAFVVPYNLSRMDFVKENSHLIEKELFRPIYENKGITIIPDMSYAVPGFYVLSYKSFIHHCDEIPDNLMMRTSLLIKYLRKAMKETLEIECCNLYSDEKKRISNVLHYWFIPKYPKYLKNGLDHKLMDINLNEYLSNFKYSEYKNKILNCNLKMKQYFENNNIKKVDDCIYILAKRSIILSITNKCSRRCLGCYNEFREADLDTKDWLNFIDYLANNNINKITIAGGDPLCREDIFVILKHCFEKGFEVNLDTVGTFLIDTDENLQKKYKNSFSWDILRKINFIGIPLDGSNSTIANKFRNESDLFVERQIKIINKLIENKCSVSVNTVLNKQNYNDMESIYKLINNLKIKKWQIFQFMGIGKNAVQNINMFDISNNKFEEVKKEIENFTKFSKFKVNIKSEESRYGRYIIIDSLGTAFVVASRNNPKIEIGNITKEEDKNKIIERYHFIG